MNKRETAQFLNVSEKSIERYVKAGKLHPVENKVNGRTRPEICFDDEEIKRLKEQMELIASPSINIATKNNQNMIDSRDLMASILDRLTVIAEQSTDRQSVRKVSTVPIFEKLLLTKREAVALSGLSMIKIEELLKTKKLKGYLNIFGNGWRIKRKELETYIKKF